MLSAGCLSHRRDRYRTRNKPGNFHTISGVHVRIVQHLLPVPFRVLYLPSFTSPMSCVQFVFVVRSSLWHVRSSTTILSTRTNFVSILGYSFTWPHYARNLALSKSYKTATGWQAANQNTRQNHIVCIVSKDVVQHLTKTLNFFQRKLLLQTESCTVQSVEVYCQSSLIATFTYYVHKESLAFWVTFLSLGMKPLSTLKAPIWLQIRQNYVSMA